uniref:Uncharacterized protein n=1 Tax=Manihot esculenta TaxID=3983 RepID=A0A2C9ULU0_MANES
MLIGDLDLYTKTIVKLERNLQSCDGGWSRFSFLDTNTCIITLFSFFSLIFIHFP